jgi:hypothetical protein
MKLYLTGGAFGMIYQMGVLRRLRRIHTIKKIYGNSAGALLGLMLLLGYTDEELRSVYDDIADRAIERILGNPFNFDSYCLTGHHFYVLDAIHKRFPDAYRQIGNRLFIGVTPKSGFRWINKFKSNAHLFNTLLCSFQVPILCSYDAKIDGELCVDGGFGFDHRHLPKNVVTVCPTYDCRAEYNGHMPLYWCALPPPMHIRDYYYNLVNTIGGISYIDENVVPEFVWHKLREHQFVDKQYNVDKYNA